MFLFIEETLSTGFSRSVKKVNSSNNQVEGWYMSSAPAPLLFESLIFFKKLTKITL